MEIPTIPQAPADYGYLVTVLVAFLSLGSVLAILGVRNYLAYRDRREADDKAYRDEQTKLQQAQWERESAARDAFRKSFEERQDKRFDTLESDAEAFSGEIQGILKAQQEQISQLKQVVDRLIWEKESKQPPKEGG